MDIRKFQKEYYQQIKIGSLLPGLFEYLEDVCFFLKDTEGKIIIANSTLIRMYNMKDETDIIGKTDYDFLEKFLADKYRADDLRIIRSGVPSFNMIELVLTHVGIPDWYITNKIPVYSKNDEVIGIMGTIRYISATQINNGKQDTNSFIHKVLNFIANNVGENLTVHSMALHFNLSVRSFEKKFLDYMKVSPKLFIIKYKISKACDDLIKYGNISQAAIENGFYDQSSFTNQFKKHMGVTPLQYIKRYRK